MEFAAIFLATFTGTFLVGFALTSLYLEGKRHEQ